MFGVLVHGLGADLHLNRPARRVAHHGVQRLVAIGFGLGDVVVKLLGDRAEARVHPAQRRVAGRHIGNDDAQRADVIDPLKAQALAAHFFNNAVNVFRPPLHLRCNALPGQLGRQLCAQCLYRRFTFGTLLIQLLGHIVVGLRLQKTEGQVLHGPLHLPNPQPVGQRGKHIQRLLRQAGRHWQLARGKVAQGLQARGQTQHHHPQVARKSQQHLAHALKLRGLGMRLGRMAGGVLGNACHALQAHQLGGLQSQRRQAFPKTLGNDLLRLVQVVAGVDQIGRRLHGGRGAHASQNGGHAIRMREHILAGIQQNTGQQRLGKRTGPQQRTVHLRLGCGQRRDQRGGGLVNGSDSLGLHADSGKQKVRHHVDLILCNQRGRVANAIDCVQAGTRPALAHLSGGSGAEQIRLRTA